MAAIKDSTDLLPNMDRTSGNDHQIWIDIGLIVGAALLVSLGVVIWATVFRKRRRHRKPVQIMGADRSADPDESSSSRRRRRGQKGGGRYSRRNPTLAETGGLPPVRSDADEPPLSRSENQLPS